MAKTFWARREGHRIVPYDRGSAFILEELPQGQAFRVEATVPRNGKHHRLMFKLFALTAQALNDGPTPRRWTTEDVSDHIKIATGHVEEMRLRAQDAKRYGTSIALRPKSISYASMSQVEFEEFAARAMDYISTDLCPWIQQSDYYGEILGIVGESRRETA